MQTSNQSYKLSIEGIRGDIKTVRAQNGGTKGHSKPGTGGTHAGPPPPPKPQSTKR